MSRVAKEIVFAAMCVALALIFLVNTDELISSAAMFPRLLIGVVIVLSALMVYQAYRARKTEEYRAEREAEARRPPIQTKRLVIFTCLCIGYIASVGLLGYFLSTPLFIIITYAYLRSVKLKTSILIAIGFSLFIYVLFVRILYLPVPLGLLENILEAW